MNLKILKYRKGDAEISGTKKPSVLHIIIINENL